MSNSVIRLERGTLHNAAMLSDYVDRIGILPLLSIGSMGWSAEDAVADDCGYTTLPDGGWEWPLWDWKGDVVRESGCAYGSYVMDRATFVSRDLWPDFCNLRRSLYPAPDEGSIDDMVLQTLRESGGLTTRSLRAACDFVGPKMRGRFATIIKRLERGCRIVTKDFVYPTDRHGKEYGWGWSLLTTPEQHFGRDFCRPGRSPEESYARLSEYLLRLFPDGGDAFCRHVLCKG